MSKIISWVEIPSSDFERAVRFYSALLKVELVPLDFGTEKMAAFPNNEGAVVYEANTHPGSSGVVVSLNVPDSIEEALERVIGFGGKVVREKTKIEAENMGYFALFLDCEGNRLGLYADA